MLLNGGIMSSDEIAKLHQLFKDGALTQEEYDRQKQTILGKRQAKPWRKTWWGRSLVALAVIGGVAIGLDGILGLSGTGAKLPNCNSSEARETLVGAFNQSQFAKQHNLSVIELAQISELSASDNLRTCQAQVTMNNTEKEWVTYKLEPRERGRFMLLFEVVEAPAKGQPAKVAAEAPKQVQPPSPVSSQPITPGGSVQTNPLLSANWDQGKNIAMAVRAFNKVQEEGGVVAVIPAVHECRKQVAATKDPQKGEYCAAFDIAAHQMYAALEQLKGWPKHEFWDADMYVIRQETLLDAIGVPEDEIEPAFMAIKTAVEQEQLRLYRAKGRGQ